MKKIIAILAVLVACVHPALAQEMPMLSAPKAGKITQENIYNYSVQTYTPAIKVPNKISQRKLPRNSAENMAIIHFNAMLMGDYGLWLSLWDEKSRGKLVSNHMQKGQDAKFWMNWWQRSFEKFSSFTLTRRIQTGDNNRYVIIEMKASNQAGETLYVDVPLMRTKTGNWFPTQALAEDPVFSHWRKTNHKIHVKMNNKMRFK